MKIVGLTIFLCVFSMLSCQSRLDRDALVAEVNKRAIEVRELENALVRMGHFPGKDLGKKETRIDIVKEMIKEELLFQEAHKQKIHEQSYAIKKAMVREFLQKKFSGKKYDISKSEIEKKFEEKKNEIEKVRASHILVKSESEAKELSQQLTRSNFSELAKIHSQDKASVASGGDLGVFVRGQMVPEFSKVAFELEKIGSISAPVKSQFGYHIIMLTGDQRGISFHGPNLKKFLQNQKKKEAIESYIKTLKGSSKIKLYSENVMKAKAAPSIENALQNK